jgi:hypothetical protein
VAPAHTVVFLGCSVTTGAFTTTTGGGVFTIAGFVDARESWAAMPNDGALTITREAPTAGPTFIVVAIASTEPSPSTALSRTRMLRVVMGNMMATSRETT